MASLWIRWAHRKSCQVSSLAHGDTQAHIQVCVHIHYMQIHRHYSGCVCAVWRIPGIFSSLLLALHDDWFCKRFIIRYNMIFLFFLRHACMHTHTQTFIHEYLPCLAMRVGVCTKCSWLGLCPDAHMLAGRAGHMAIWWKVEIQPIDFDLLSCFCNGRLVNGHLMSRSRHCRRCIFVCFWGET